MQVHATDPCSRRYQRPFFILFFLFYLNSSLVTAETKIRAGLLAGISASHFIGADSAPDFDFQKSPALGLFLRITRNDKIFFQPEIVYTIKGETTTKNPGDRNQYEHEYELKYLDFNLLFGFRNTENVIFLTGPYLGVLLNGTLTKQINPKESYRFDHSSHFPVYDYGITIGTSITVFKHLFIESRYSLGLQGVYPEYGFNPEPGVGTGKFKNIRNSTFVLLCGVHF